MSFRPSFQLPEEITASDVEWPGQRGLSVPLGQYDGFGCRKKRLSSKRKLAFFFWREIPNEPGSLLSLWIGCTIQECIYSWKEQHLLVGKAACIWLHTIHNADGYCLQGQIHGRGGINYNKNIFLGHTSGLLGRVNPSLKIDSEDLSREFLFKSTFSCKFPSRKGEVWNPKVFRWFTTTWDEQMSTTTRDFRGSLFI